MKAISQQNTDPVSEFIAPAWTRKPELEIAAGFWALLAVPLVLVFFLARAWSTYLVAPVLAPPFRYLRLREQGSGSLRALVGALEAFAWALLLWIFVVGLPLFLIALIVQHGLV